MNQKKKVSKIDIVYIFRNISEKNKPINNLNLLKRFVNSYKNLEKIKTNYESSLHCIYKGRREIELVKKIESEFDHIIFQEDVGFDIGSYMKFLENSNSEYILPMSSSSYFNYSFSLNKLIETVEQKDCVIASSNCVYTSYKKSILLTRKVFYKCGFFYALKYIFACLRLYIYGFEFPKYPNPHIRTTGFICKTSFLKEFFNKHKFPSSKKECHKIESGYDSIYNFALNYGDICLTTASMKTNQVCEWIKISPFCKGIKEALIVDNRLLKMFEKSRKNIEYKKLLIWQNFI